MSFEQWLQAKGWDSEALSESKLAALRLAWKAETAPVARPVEQTQAASNAGQSAGAATVTSPIAPASANTASPLQTIDEISAANRRERDRQDTITEMLASAIQRDPRNDHLEPLARQAIKDNWSVPKFELELLKLERPRYSPAVFGGSHERPPESEVLEAAICKFGKLGSLEKQFSERTLDAADRQFRHGVGLHELVGICARQNGWRGSDVKRDLRGAMRAAFFGGHDGHGYGPRSASLSGGPSTISVSGILSNIGNKFLRDSWNAVEQAWRRITAIRSVTDFKTITTYSLTGDLTYEKVAPGGEIRHGTLGNETYTNRADTYGKLILLDRRDVINDDLGAFINIFKRLGRGGALKLNDVFWTEFMASASTFWTAGRGNYDDGTDTAFGNDGLTAADVIWQAKTDPDGKPLGLMAKILLVPPGHRIPALRLMSSQFFGTTGEEGEKNPWAGMFEVVSSVYLANSNYTGYSALAWYMLADPNELPVIETAFLNGMEAPTVEDVEPAADHLGMGIRAYHDFGCAKQEYRAGLKLKGEA